jgi:hypothetical protein
MSSQDPEQSTAWILTLYGSAMLAVQGLENMVAMLYFMGGHDPHRKSNASMERQARNAFSTGWSAFQKGTAGMKLNDAKRGVKRHVDPDVYERLDNFIKGPRAQLAHRFLIERIVPSDAGPRFIRGSAAYLVGAAVEASELTALLHRRLLEIMSTWPEPERASVTSRGISIGRARPHPAGTGMSTAREPAAPSSDAEAIIRGVELPVTVYLRKRWAEQAFWEYVASTENPVPTPLRFLVTEDRVLVGADTAHRVLDYFHGLGFRDYVLGHVRTPVEVVDYDGNPVPLAQLAPAA